MRFKHELIVPKNTLAADPEIARMYLVKGRLQKILIGFPPGCASMVHVIFKDGLLQISPSSPGETHHWDRYVEEIPMDYDLTDVKHLIKIFAWSPNTIYQHKLSVSFDVIPAGEQSERELLLTLFKLPTV